MLDASGMIHIQGDRFLVAEDELDVLRYFVLDRQKLTFSATTEVIHFGHRESDFESLAFDPREQRYYCIGSHGEDYSERLLSFELAGSEASKLRVIRFDARHLVNEDVDIEGLSVWGTHLFMGYRRPSRNSTALAVLFDIKSGAQLLTSFDLAGRTFRDVVRIDDENYLILAGPQQGRDYDSLPSRIFWWNGDIFLPQLKQCDVELDKFRAEGIATRICSDGSLEVLIGSDESKTKSAKCFRLMYLNVPAIANLKQERINPLELKVTL
jgi:hypothetical protein